MPEASQGGNASLGLAPPSAVPSAESCLVEEETGHKRLVGTFGSEREEVAHTMAGHRVRVAN